MEKILEEFVVSLSSKEVGLEVPKSETKPETLNKGHTLKRLVKTSVSNKHYLLTLILPHNQVLDQALGGNRNQLLRSFYSTLSPLEKITFNTAPEYMATT